MGECSRCIEVFTVLEQSFSQLCLIELFLPGMDKADKTAGFRKASTMQIRVYLNLD